MNLKFLFNSGKNPKLHYYIRNYSKVIFPKFVFQSRLNSKLKSIPLRPDSDYLLSRVKYYNKHDLAKELPESSKQFSDLKKGKEVSSVYFLDAYARTGITSEYFYLKFKKYFIQNL